MFRLRDIDQLNIKSITKGVPNTYQVTEHTVNKSWMSAKIVPAIEELREQWEIIHAHKQLVLQINSVLKGRRTPASGNQEKLNM